MPSAAFEQDLRRRNRTRVAVIATSKSMVDAVLDVANEDEVAFVLGFDRRLGELPSTAGASSEVTPMADIVRHVRDRDRAGRVLLARFNANLASIDRPAPEESRRRSLAKDCLTADIAAGLDLIHIDASWGDDGPVALDVEVDRQVDLVGHAHAQARKIGRELSFSLGASSRGPFDAELTEFPSWLDATITSLVRAGLPLPLFVNLKAGTCVRGLANVGPIAALQAGAGDAVEREALIAEATAICELSGVHSVVMDVDFLANSALRTLAFLGVDLASFGLTLAVDEMRTLIRLAEATGYRSIRDALYEIGSTARGQETFLPADRRASDHERALVGGVFAFGTTEFSAVKARLEARCGAAGVLLDEILRDTHRRELRRLVRELDPNTRTGSARRAQELIS